MADDVVTAAADILYRVPPDRFVGERTSLAEQAKANGDADASKVIGALARPTKAAWVLNRLAREFPDVIERLVVLGVDLQSAQASLDATALRELSDRRRSLVREASKQAFALAGEPRPSTALATEVQDTLTAAVVEPGVGEALLSGALLRATQASGFGPSGPDLAAVPATARRTSPAGSGGSQNGRASSDPNSEPHPDPQAGPEPEPQPSGAGPRATNSKRNVAAERRAGREATARRRRVQAADTAVAEAREAVGKAVAGETEARDQVRMVAEQLADAERSLGDAGLAVREARAGLKRAEQARRDVTR